MIEPLFQGRRLSSSMLIQDFGQFPHSLDGSPNDIGKVGPQKAVKKVQGRPQKTSCNLGENNSYNGIFTYMNGWFVWFACR